MFFHDPSLYGATLPYKDINQQYGYGYGANMLPWQNPWEMQRFFPQNYGFTPFQQFMPFQQFAPWQALQTPFGGFNPFVQSQYLPTYGGFFGQQYPQTYGMQPFVPQHFGQQYPQHTPFYGVQKIF